MVPLIEKEWRFPAVIVLTLALLSCFGKNCSAQELRLETPAERADAAQNLREGTDERSPRSDNEGPKVLGGWTSSGVWLEPNRHAYYPSKGLVLDKITGRWHRPIRRSSNWRPTNPYNVRNEVASNCSPCSPRQPTYTPTTVSPCSPTPAPSLPTYQPSYNRPVYVPTPVYTPAPVYIPPTYPVRVPYPDYHLRQGLRYGGSLEKNWKPSRTPISSLVQ